MILTEEQRAAIKLAMKYIARWPFAYKELHARGVLQAMIDSSGTVEPVGGFDLEKARAADEVLPYPLDAKEIWVSGKGQMHINPPNAPSIFFTLSDLCEFRNIFHGQAAEIERLRAENEGLSKTVIDIQEERDLAQAEFRSYHRAWEEQAARVQELEEALVEMVATNPCNIPTLCDVVHDELMCPALDGNCDFWKGCPQKNELREAARKQLQAEGKIGPDAKPREGLYGKYRISKADGSPVDPGADYFVLRLDSDPVARRAALQYSYMTPDRTLAIGLQEKLTKYNPKMEDCINLQFFGMERPRVWQITEERKAAIMETIDLLNGDLFRSPYSDVLAVLRGMLEEVA